MKIEKTFICVTIFKIKGKTSNIVGENVKFLKIFYCIHYNFLIDNGYRSANVKLVKILNSLKDR